MAKPGRPTLSKKLKKVNFGFTASPQLGSKLRKIKGAKSPFIEACLGAIPDQFIENYNRDADQFLAEARARVVKFDRKSDSTPF